jgi:diguanylate cyclase (GGDEF)-like protein
MLKQIKEPVLAILFLGIVVVLAMQGMREIEAQTRTAAGKSLQTVLHTTEEDIHLWAQNRINDAQSIALRSEVIDLTKEMLGLPRRRDAIVKDDVLRRTRDAINPDIERLGYLGFFIIAPDFISLSSMRDGSVGVRNVIADQRPGLLERVFRGDSVIIPAIASDITLRTTAASEGRAPPTMFAATPIIDASGEILAVFTIRIDPISDFSSLTGLGRIGATGETYAFSRDGYLLTESRFDDQLRGIGLLKSRQQSVLSVRVADPGGNTIKGYRTSIPINERPLTLMASDATLGNCGQNTDGYRDYRGVSVFGAWLWDENIGLGLTTEIDAGEALQPYFFARRVIVAGLGVTMLLSFLFAGYLVVARSRALRELEKGKVALEARVSERTNDLLSINDKLQEQVMERVRTEEQLKLAHAQLEETNEKLEQIAVTEGLTGVANRRSFDGHLDAEWNRCMREKKPISLIMFDVDFFKRFNDAYGHQAGDACLKLICDVLRGGSQSRRPGDIVARYGGEEFSVILSGAGEQDAARIAEKIRTDVLERAIPHGATEVKNVTVVTLSVGVATTVPPFGLAPKSLIDFADSALYEAKKNGRNCMVVAKINAARVL